MVVVIESLRADRILTERRYMPFLQGIAAQHVSFENAHSNGTMTGESFPIIFNGEYLSGVQRAATKAPHVWGQLRAAGVQTAFISAGAMEWAGLDRILALDQMDFLFTASHRPAGERIQTAAFAHEHEANDYAVSDETVLQEFNRYLAHADPSKRQFVVLHLVGSHYPYRSAREIFPAAPELPPAEASSAPARELSLSQYFRQETWSSTKLQDLIASYDRSLVAVDSVLIDAVESVRRNGLLEDSAIIVTADHGESFGEHGLLFHGTAVYSQQTHVPLIVRLGDNLHHLRERLLRHIPHPVGTIDVLPTVLDLFGLNELASSLDGWSLLRAESKPYEFIIASSLATKFAVVRGQDKFVYDLGSSYGEHFDLAADPGENDSLWRDEVLGLEEFLSHLAARGIVRDFRGADKTES